MKEQRIKGGKGITLIALVVTIVVLIILAIVAVRAVQDGGLIKKSKESTTKYTEGQVREEVQLVLNDGYVAYNNYNTPLKDYLQEKFGKDAVVETSDGYEITYKGYKTTVGKDYKIASIKELEYNEIKWLWHKNADGKTATITGIDTTGMAYTEGEYDSNCYTLYLKNDTLTIPSTIEDENGNKITVTSFVFNDVGVDGRRN